jgi:hypothetical protein
VILVLILRRRDAGGRCGARGKAKQQSVSIVHLASPPNRPLSPVLRLSDAFRHFYRIAPPPSMAGDQDRRADAIRRPSNQKRRRSRKVGIADSSTRLAYARRINQIYRIDAVAGSLRRPGRALTLREMDDAVAREAERRARD